MENREERSRDMDDTVRMMYELKESEVQKEMREELEHGQGLKR